MSYDESSAKSIYLRAAEIADPAERQAFVRHECGQNDELQARVENLLKSASAPDSLLDRPAADFMATQGTAADDVSSVLDFLDPSEVPGRLGRLGGYEILEVIGRGGMGIVFRAMDGKLNRVVAIKVLAPEFACQPQARRRFLREAQAAAAVSHDHIVTIHAVDDGGSSGNKPPFIVMECIVGQSLQQKLDRVGGLSLKEILRIGTQIASGLAAAHKQGLVHRDIKPANILLENGIERVKITDFGLARAIDDASITQTGHIAGTPAYMSPEQASGQAIDQRSDLFSLGSVLYAMTTGKAAFSGDSVVAVLRRVCEDPPQPIGELTAEVPDWLVAIIDRLMAKQPENRFASAQEVAVLLERWLAHCQRPEAVARPAEDAQPVPATSTPFFAWLQSNTVELVLGFTFLTMCAVCAGAGNLWISLAALGVGSLVVWMIHVYQSQQATTASTQQSERPRGTLGRAWQDWWSQRDRWVTIGVQSVLIVIYLVCMIAFVSMSSSQGQNAEGNTTFEYRLGAPSPWYRFEAYPEPLTPFRFGFNLLTSSVALGLLGCLAYAIFWQIEKIRDPQTSRFNRPAFMLGVWGVGALGAVAFGFYQGYSAMARPKTQVAKNSDAVEKVNPIAANSEKASNEQQHSSAAANQSTLSPQSGPVPRRIKWFDPQHEMATAPPWATQATAVKVENGVWRFENDTNHGNFKIALPPVLEDIPEQGLIVFRCQIKLDTTHPLAWGDLQLGDFGPEHFKFGWPSVLFTYREAIPEWTKKEVRYPASAFSSLSPPRIEPYLGLHANGVLWVKDVELLHLPDPQPRAEAGAATSTLAEAHSRQTEAARTLGVAVEHTNSIGMKLRLIPAGEFTMGTPAADADRPAAQSDWYFARWTGERRQAERPTHAVRISRPYYIGIHEVTIGQFAEYLKATKGSTAAENDTAGGYAWANGEWKRRDTARWHNPGFVQTDEHPVCNVAWQDAVEFCQWLSRLEGVEYRLPREAEWEYACRAGTQTIYSTGNDPQSLQGYANVADAALVGVSPDRSIGWAAAWNDGFAFTAPVGSYNPNGFGLFDMHGNTHEWCHDWYSADYYASSPAIDPAGPATGKQHVYRGGGWDNWIGFCRSADRYGSHSESLRTDWAGFRVVLVGDLKQATENAVGKQR